MTVVALAFVAALALVDLVLVWRWGIWERHIKYLMEEVREQRQRAVDSHSECEMLCASVRGLEAELAEAMKAQKVQSDLALKYIEVETYRKAECEQLEAELAEVKKGAFGFMIMSTETLKEGMARNYNEFNELRNDLCNQLTAKEKEIERLREALEKVLTLRERFMRHVSHQLYGLVSKRWKEDNYAGQKPPGTVD